MADGLAITGHLAIDVFGVEAVRAMVALSSSGYRGTDELLAVATLERLVRFRSWRTENLFLSLEALGPSQSVLAAMLAFFGREIVTRQVVVIVVAFEVFGVSGSHVNVLRAARMNRGGRDGWLSENSRAQQARVSHGRQAWCTCDQ